MCDHTNTHEKYYEVRDESGHLEENGYAVYCEDCGECITGDLPVCNAGPSQFSPYPANPSYSVTGKYEKKSA